MTAYLLTATNVHDCLLLVHKYTSSCADVIIVFFLQLFLLREMPTVLDKTSW